MNRENAYLLYKYYHIYGKDDHLQIMLKAIQGAYMDPSRHGMFPVRMDDSRRENLVAATKNILADRIPLLLQATHETDDGQKTFDDMHHEICELIMQIYHEKSAQTYGIAQKWLNLALLHLAIIESNMETGYWPVKDTRKHFHVPAVSAVLEAATIQKRKYPYELGLKCAPLLHDDPNEYQMDWYSSQKTQRVEEWGYREYMEFQITVRNELKKGYVEPNGIYRDCLDWAFHASIERGRHMVF